MLLLTSCGTADSKPALRDYDKAWQAALAGEVIDMNAKNIYPNTREALRDYSGLRDQVRVMH